jgi:hypothetical protein
MNRAHGRLKRRSTIDKTPLVIVFTFPASVAGVEILRGTIDVSGERVESATNILADIDPPGFKCGSSSSKVTICCSGRCMNTR